MEVSIVKKLRGNGSKLGTNCIIFRVYSGHVKFHSMIRSHIDSFCIASVFHRKIGKMSGPTFSKLASPLKELLSGGSLELGKSEKDKADVIEWIEKVSQGDIVKPEAIRVRRRLL